MSMYMTDTFAHLWEISFSRVASFCQSEAVFSASKSKVILKEYGEDKIEVIAISPELHLLCYSTWLSWASLGRDSRE